MIAIDTNILVRYIARDDPQQTDCVDALMEDRLTTDQPGFVSTITLCEMLWVLRDKYGYPNDAQVAVVETLRDAAQIVIEHDDCVGAALASRHADLADSLIHFVGRKAGCTHTLTFDKKFARMDGVELLAE